MQGNRRKTNQVQGTDSICTVSKMDKLTERPRHPSGQGAKRRQSCKIRGPEDDFQEKTDLRESSGNDWLYTGEAQQRRTPRAEL